MNNNCEALISVIVPIYNVEKYLEKCILSIINQTYENIEILLVNDGSPDNSLMICEKYSKLDSRINVINKKNGGLSDARNAGMRQAKGQYFLLVDSDDFIHPQMVELLYKSIQESNADIAVCNYSIVQEGTEVSYTSYNADKLTYELLNRDEAILEQFNEKCTEFTVAWNKLYHRDVFKDVEYPVGKIHEDDYTTYKLIYNSSKVAYIENELYFYLQRTNSIMGESFSINRFNRVIAKKQRLDFLIEQKIHIEKAIRAYFDAYKEYIDLYSKAFPENKREIKKYKKDFSREKRYYSKFVSFSKYIVICVKSDFPELCEWIRDKKNGK